MSSKKLQYTYRSATTTTDAMAEFIQSGVDKAGSFPKFVDKLVVYSMAGEDGGDAAMAVDLPSAGGNVDLSGVEARIDNARKDIISVIQSMGLAPTTSPDEPAPAINAQGLASRKDLVALRKAVAADMIRAKSDEVEKLDELLSIVKAMKEQVSSKAAAQVTPSTALAPVEDDEPSDLFGDITSSPFYEDDEPKATSTKEDMSGLPFDDDDFAAGISALVGVDYAAEVPKTESVPSKQRTVAHNGYEDAPKQKKQRRDPLYDVAPDPIQEPESEYDYDDDVLAGARVLLGLA